MGRPITTAILAAFLGLCTLEPPTPASADSVTLMLTPSGDSADLINTRAKKHPTPVVLRQQLFPLSH
jgi:hypothetical protein